MTHSMTRKAGLITMLSVAALVACTGCSSAGAGAEGSQSTTAAADSSNGPDSAGWCHGDLTATDGTNVDFDYKVVMSRAMSEGHIVENGSSPSSWLHVENPAFTGSEDVNVTVIDFGYEAEDGAPDYHQNGVYQVHLSWDAASARFTGQVGQPLPTYQVIEGDDDFELHRYQLATQVDGTWLTDPVNGTHNFNFDMGRQSGSCQGYTWEGPQ